MENEATLRNQNIGCSERNIVRRAKCAEAYFRTVRLNTITLSSRRVVHTKRWIVWDESDCDPIFRAEIVTLIPTYDVVVA